MADIAVLAPANHLTIDEHVDRIRGALDRARTAVFDLVGAIKDAHDQLGKDVFQSQLAERLGMNPSTLSRWLQIGNSQFLMSQQERLRHEEYPKESTISLMGPHPARLSLKPVRVKRRTNRRMFSTRISPKTGSGC